MSTLPRNSEIDNRVGPNLTDESLRFDKDVIFRGDGEPQSTDVLLGRLAEIESDTGLSPDYYSLGGSVAALENYFAAALGKESSIFMPTGTLANHLAIRALCGVKSRAIVQEQSHLYHDSGDCVTQLSGINLVPLANGRTCFTLEELTQAVAESTSGRVANPIGAVMIESPVRRQMGQVVSFDEMKAITGYCRDQGIGTHLDGARLYMMSAASGVSPRQYSDLFDTVYVSMYKYFGAPYGAILAGDSELIDGMFHTRRMFGGGLSSSYFAAGLALKGAEGFEEQFGDAMKKGRDLIQRINTLPNVVIREFEHGSNIFPLDFAPELDITNVTESLSRNHIYIYADEGTDHYSRLTVNITILRQPNEAIFSAFEEALKSG